MPIPAGAPVAAGLFLYGETVTRLRAPLVTDPYSKQPIPDWDSPPEETPIPGCGFDPGGSSEPVQDGRNAVVTQPNVLMAYGVDVTAYDRLRVRGTVFDVDGEPAFWRNPMTGWQAGMRVNLKQVEG